MPITSLAPSGAIGLVKDVRPAELPAQAWTTMLNARCADGGVLALPGKVAVGAAMPQQGIWGVATQDPSSGAAIWLVMGAAKGYAYINGAYTDVTRASGGDYIGQTLDRWSGGVLGGVPIANNGRETPQVWLTPAAGNKLVNLANWPADTKAKSLRTYKQFLVALDVTKSGVRYPTLVKWSHPADPGTVPTSWNEADPTKDAGEYPLSETAGPVVDSLPLKDTNIIYKTDSVWGMQYIGGEFIFKFFKIFGDFGMPYRDCAAEFVSGKHIVFTGTDLVVHDGQSSKSIAQGRIRSILRNITENQLPSCYMAVHNQVNEVWFCFRRASDQSAKADTAICYNWADNTLTMRELDQLYYITSGKIDPPNISSGSTWADATADWGSNLLAWGESIPVTGNIRLLGFGASQLYWLDATPAVAEAVTLEREYLGVVMQSTQPPDMTAMKFVRRIWPRFTGKVGDVVNITLGSSDSVAEVTTWKDPQQFIIGQDTKIDCTLSGKLFALRITSAGTEQWCLNGVEADVNFLGQN